MGKLAQREALVGGYSDIGRDIEQYFRHVAAGARLRLNLLALPDECGCNGNWVARLSSENQAQILGDRPIEGEPQVTEDKGGRNVVPRQIDRNPPSLQRHGWVDRVFQIDDVIVLPAVQVVYIATMPFTQQERVCREAVDSRRSAVEFLCGAKNSRGICVRPLRP